jgi:hypothetical protein
MNALPKTFCLQKEVRQEILEKFPEIQEISSSSIVDDTIVVVADIVSPHVLNAPGIEGVLWLNVESFCIFFKYFKTFLNDIKEVEVKVAAEKLINALSSKDG